LPRRRLIVILVPGVQAINIALSTAGAVVTWVTYRQILCLVGLAAIGGVSLSP
jgi:energy-converting hydrogenase Eha subunit E